MKDFDFEIYPISDSALTIDFGNQIDELLNQYIIDLAESIDNQGVIDIIEVLPAYSTLTIFYKSSPSFKYENMKNWLLDFIKKTQFKNSINQSNQLIQIPIIYDGEDLGYVAEYCKISIKELIKIHSEATYRVFMMGFLPGFAYLGGMDERIAVPRKNTPRVKVNAGSVGIAGKQTGIYPIDSPGGWQLIGRTNLKLFDKNKSPSTLLRAGDFVKFIIK